MREIKFRAWVEKANKMADWDLIKKECDRLSVLENNDFIFMQYTGLKDKKGVEIYEGDIVKYCNESEYTKKEYWNPIYKLYYKPTKLDYKFIGKGKSPDNFAFALEYWPSEIEIIGNIHQNSELLK